MICRRKGDGWEIVYQRNHALLAATMLEDWAEEKRVQPWFQLLNACSQHDHGWQENEDDPRVSEEGYPADFLHMPMDTTLAMSRRNLRNAEAQSHWCAILVARHAEYLYSFKDDDQTKAYLKEVHGERRQWMKEIGVDEGPVEEMYELLRWADSLSLLVCCEPSDFTRSLELVAQGEEYTARDCQDGRTWTLHPWPYRQRSLSLEYEVRYLSQPRFPSHEALRAVLSSAAVTVRKLEMQQESA